MVSGDIKSIEPDVLVQEVNVSIVDFEIVDGQFNFVKESSINNAEYLHVERILGPEKLNVSVVLFFLNTFSKIGSD